MSLDPIEIEAYLKGETLEQQISRTLGEGFSILQADLEKSINRGLQVADMLDKVVEDKP